MSKIADILKEEDVKTSKVEPKKEEKKDDAGSITLTKDEFSAITERLNRLEKTANKARLTNYDRLNQENPETIYRLRTIDGKIVLGWSNLISNRVEINPENKRYEEDQRLEVYYEDETKEEMSVVFFNRRYQHLETVLLSEELLRDKEKIAKHGNRVFKLKDPTSGKEYLVGEKFVN